jgi:hypothetical protein
MIAGRMKERNGVDLVDSIEFGDVTLQGIFGLPERRALFSLLTGTAVAPIAPGIIMPPKCFNPMESPLYPRTSQLRFNLDQEICHAF